MLPSQAGFDTRPAESGPGGVALDPRRKRALFRAWHRGTREMDLIMGRFADREIGSLSEEEFGLFERLLDIPEPELFGWIMGSALPPPDIDESFLARLRAFRGLT